MIGALPASLSQPLNVSVLNAFHSRHAVSKIFVVVQVPTRVSQMRGNDMVLRREGDWVTAKVDDELAMMSLKKGTDIG